MSKIGDGVKAILAASVEVEKISFILASKGCSVSERSTDRVLFALSIQNVPSFEVHFDFSIDQRCPSGVPACWRIFGGTFFAPDGFRETVRTYACASSAINLPHQVPLTPKRRVGVDRRKARLPPFEFGKVRAVSKQAAFNVSALQAAVGADHYQYVSM